jgi:TolB-like protein/DNA-binding SARP family transcriptional activator
MKLIAPGGIDILPRARKTRAVLACLCLAEGEPVLRSRLIGLLWDRSGEAQARMSLRHALSELKQSVNDRAPDLIEIDREAVHLNMSACWVDVFTGPEPSERLLEDLDGITPAFDQWLASERARFEDRIRTKLEQELDRLSKENSPPQLRAAAARKLISFEPTHEGAVRALMAAFVQLGDRPQAIREYERCRTALRSMLDMTPSKETVALYEAVRLLSSSQATGLPKPAAVVLDNNKDSGGVLLKALPLVAAPVHEPSIAVLPFRTMSADAAHDYAADGLVEDLIEVLSRVPNLFVISRLSTLAFKGQDRLPQEIGTVLGVQYVLSGSMRVMGERLRLTVELTDTSSGTGLWSSRLDEKSFDLFEVQHRLADAIVRRVAPYLHAAELKRVRSKRPDHLGAYDLFLRAQENMHNSSRDIFETSEQLFDQALRLEPAYATALAWRAYWHVLRVGQGWSCNPEEDTRKAKEFARLAVDADGLEPMALAVQGHIDSYLHKKFDAAFRGFEAALRINPNAAPAWLWSAAANAWIGKGACAVEQVNRAISLSPYDPLIYAYSMIASIAYLVDGQTDRAIECAIRSISENGTYTSAHRILVIALEIAGRHSDAELAAYDLKKLEPSLTVERFRRRYPGSDSAHAAVFCDALAKAGIPMQD